ncbi:hypothetical protein ACS0TY_007921 [Phlomoides rotata]
MLATHITAAAIGEYGGLQRPSGKLCLIFLGSSLQGLGRHRGATVVVRLQYRGKRSQRVCSVGFRRLSLSFDKARTLRSLKMKTHTHEHFPPVSDVERVKVSCGRRSWSKIEEDALILCLTNVVLEGWKSENGFKAGFQRELEKGMRKIIPATDIVANPHINSKIHVWKKEYGALSDLLSKSRICWNSTTSMLEVEDEGVWESCKRWIEIFRKDRATSENDVDLIDHINELYRTGMDQEGDTGDKYVPLTPEYMNDIEDDVADKPVDLTPKVFTKGKKRKSNDSDITMLVDSLGEFMKFSKSAMTDLCTGAEKGSASSNDNKQLNVIMKGIVGLKVSDKLKCVTS